MLQAEHKADADDLEQSDQEAAFDDSPAAESRLHRYQTQWAQHSVVRSRKSMPPRPERGARRNRAASRAPKWK